MCEKNTNNKRHQNTENCRVPMGTGFVFEPEIELDFVAALIFQVYQSPVQKFASIYSLSLPNSNCPVQTFDTTVYKENAHSLTARRRNIRHYWSEKDNNKLKRVAQSVDRRDRSGKMHIRASYPATDKWNWINVCTRREKKYAANSKCPSVTANSIWQRTNRAFCFVFVLVEIVSSYVSWINTPSNIQTPTQSSEICKPEYKSTDLLEKHKTW